MLASLLIVFREVIEAGLIVGIVLAATNGVARRGLWIAIGVGSGVVGACLVAAFAEQLAGLFEGSGQELFNAAILLVAVLMLTWHNVWMAGHGKQMAREMHQMGTEVSTGQRTLTALAVVVGVAVLREGSEVVLFLYGIAAQGGMSTASMLAGGAMGLAAGAAVSALMYFGLLTIPAHRLFSVTFLAHHIARRRNGVAGRTVSAAGRLFRSADINGLGHILAAAGKRNRRPVAAHADRLQRHAQWRATRRVWHDHRDDQRSDAHRAWPQAGAERYSELGLVERDLSTLKHKLHRAGRDCAGSASAAPYRS